MQQFSLIIPAYNEAARINSFFNTVNTFNGEFIVVCDGTDNTVAVVEQISLSRTDLNIRCLSFPERLGKGGGVLAGFVSATNPLIGYVDADGSTNIADMKWLFSQLNTYDAVIGSRWMPGSQPQTPQGFLRRLESRGFNLIVRIMFGLDFYDTQCGAKVFKKSAIDKILPLMISNGFEFDVELLWRLKVAGYKIIETPICWQNNTETRVKPRDIFKMFFGLVKIRICR